MLGRGPLGQLDWLHPVSLSEKTQFRKNWNCHIARFPERVSCWAGDAVAAIDRRQRWRKHAMKPLGNRSSAPCIYFITLGMIIVGGWHSTAAAADTVFTWDPAAASPSLGGPFTADAINATHYLYHVSPTPITATDIYTVHFLEPITGFRLKGGPVATPGLNGTPGAPGSYGLYVTMQNQTEAVGPPKNYNYLSGQIKLMLDPGNNDGTARSTPSGLSFSNTGPTGTAD